MKRTLSLLPLLWACGGSTTPAPATAPAPLRAGHLLVALRADPGGAPGPLQGEVELGGVRGRVARVLFDGRGRAGEVPVVLLDTGARDADLTLRQARAVASDARVRSAEPDWLRAAAEYAPSDPRYPNDQRDRLAQINLPAAWERIQRLPARTPVVVGVLDSGVLPEHPDLKGQLARRGDSPQGAVDGYDFVSVGPEGNPVPRDGDPTDPGSSDPVWSSGLHGTHVSGIIAAQANNNEGIAGVCWHCRVLPVRVLGVGSEEAMRRGGSGADSDIVDGIRWAIGAKVGTLPAGEHRAEVINLSFGGGRLSFAIKQAIEEAIAAGVVVVAAAGNNGGDPKNGEAENFFPGGLNDVVSVGSCDAAGYRSAFSSWGGRVDLLAPGEGVVSTYREDGGKYSYDVLTGTSQASPHVAGAVALLKTVWPQVTPKLAVELLWESADASKRCENTPEQGCGAGVLDADRLLQWGEAQKGCKCPSGQYCDLQAKCRVPQLRHKSVLGFNALEPGCSLSGGPPRPGGPAAPLLGAGLALAWRGLRRRQCPARPAQEA